MAVHKQRILFKRVYIMKTRIISLGGDTYEVELREFDTFNGTAVRFKWYKRINPFTRNLTSKEWIRHLNN